MIDAIEINVLSDTAKDLAMHNFVRNGSNELVMYTIDISSLYNGFKLKLEEHLSDKAILIYFKLLVEQTLLLRCDDPAYIYDMENIIYLVTMDVDKTYELDEEDSYDIFHDSYDDASDIVMNVNNLIDGLSIVERSVLPYRWDKYKLSLLYNSEMNLDTIYH